MKTGENGCAGDAAFSRSGTPQQIDAQRTKIRNQWAAARSARLDRLANRPGLQVVEDDRSPAAIIKGDLIRYLGGEQLTYPEAIADLVRDAGLEWDEKYANDRVALCDALVPHVPIPFATRVRLYADGQTSRELWKWVVKRLYLYMLGVRSRAEEFEAAASATASQDAADADVFALFSGAL